MNMELTLNGKMVLIIDDKPANLEFISNYLEEAGFEVMVAQDGASGLEIALRAQPDLILLDVLMPGINGFETCRRMKSDPATKDIPVIFLTSMTERDRKITGFEVGGVDYITKPVQIEEVLARVKTHLTLRTMQKQLAEQNRKLQQEIEVRHKAEEELREAQAGLEQRVADRTAELAQANANLKAKIIDHERAEAELKLRNREQALLNRVIAASVNETSTQAILGTACRELARTFEVPQVVAALVNKAGTHTDVVAEYSEEKRPSAMNWTVPKVCEAETQKVLIQQGPVVVGDDSGDNHPAFADEWRRQRSIKSLLVVPLVLNEKLLGLIGVECPKERCFTQNELELANSVASQVSGVLTRLRLNAERRDLEAQYHQAQKMEALGRLTGGVAHDFNNILTVIIGNSELLLSRLDERPHIQQEVDQIRNAGERAAALIRQLLAFSRQQILQPKILNMNEIVVNLEKMLRRLIGEDIEMKTVADPQLGNVKADPGQIEQVIMNLVVNARDAMPKGGKLTIETANVYLDETYTQRRVGFVPGPYAMLSISDNGVGMDPDTRSRIFEPFFTTKGRGQGTGLGLATVHGIVKQSGGHIWVYSEPGQGTTFKIYLPRVTADSEAIILKQAAIKPGPGWETILLVEDEETVRELAYRVLTSDGYSVLKAIDGKSAVETCLEHKGKIHLLLTDVVMPGGKNGPQLAKELKLLQQDMKVLYMSGYTDNAIVHSGVLDRGIAFLPKPFRPLDLLQKVRDVLDKQGES